MIKSEITEDNYIKLTIEKNHPDGGTYKDEVHLTFAEANRLKHDLKRDVEVLYQKIKESIEEYENEI